MGLAFHSYYTKKKEATINTKMGMHSGTTEMNKISFNFYM